ncbi:ATP-dependent metallopeptidase Hfl [Neolentinus lepideus HHB14362 ss-1]|uniref:ATP-dependent metallopeptidase Hfl n=1 Tax=Neolentinus lepideus HHB14362 ss-1 TaxID=1314782 RepID=A0A165TBH9_9AGAM|nr:ATP-dependent metallopeptidase Hfl [Neolentinus lepideus HHB14362 ss-1]
MNLPLVYALRGSHHAPPSILAHVRTFSSFPTRLASRNAILTRAPFRPIVNIPSPSLSNTGSSLCARRTLFNWLSRNKEDLAHPHPSPSVVASISALEAEANQKPHDVEKQVALFEALTGSQTKQGLEIVKERWERMCKTDPKSPLLANDRAYALYLTSLKELGLDAEFATASSDRERLLQEHHPEVVSSSPEALDPILDSTPSSSSLQAGTSAPASASPQILSDTKAAQPNPLFAAATASGVQNPAQPSAAASPSSGLSLGSVFGKGGSAKSVGGALGGPGNPISVVVSEPKASWVPRIIRFTISTAVLGFFFLVLLSILLENSGLLKAGPRQAEFQPQQGKTYKFSDVHGVDEAKEELYDVVEFLKDPTAFASLGGRLPKGVLLTGQPGTGKTMLARAVAGEAGVPFLFASGSEFDEMFVGVGAKRVRELFAAARKKAPSIIFIDELDAIGSKRNARDSAYMKQTLNQLLVEMDGFEQGEGVVVIAATNFLEALDPALIRPGRFDRVVAVPLPDVRGRVQILKHHMKDVVTSPEVDLTILARGTPGFSGADLQNMVNQAAIQASKEHAKAVTLKHLEWAKDRIIMGAERKSSYINDHTKKLTAYHEGGHALVALYTEGAMPLHKVTCVPRGHALGVTSQLPEDDRYSVSLKEYLAEIDVCFGGRVAEELIFGSENVTSGASSDLRHATSTASRMVKNFGYSQKVGPVYYSDAQEGISPHKREEIENEIRSLLQAGEARVAKLLKSKEDELHRVSVTDPILASALIEYETLDLEEVKKVVRGEKIRDIKEVIQEDLERIDKTENPNSSVSGIMASVAGPGHDRIPTPTTSTSAPNTRAQSSES